MKKLITGAVTVFVPFVLFAQGNSPAIRPDQFSEYLTVPGILFVIYLIWLFILTIIRWHLDHRLRSKLVEKGVSENIVQQFLQPRNRDIKAQALKWALVLAGAGMGLTIFYYTLPLNIHSIGIMAFCLALSFLGYFYYLKQSETKEK
jgi:hypothetical protein